MMSLSLAFSGPMIDTKEILYFFLIPYFLFAFIYTSLYFMTEVKSNNKK